MKSIALDPQQNIITIQFPYSQGLVERVKEEVPGRRWDRDNAWWWVTANPRNAKAVLEFGKKYGFPVQTPVLHLAQSFKGQTENYDRLYRFQREDVAFLHDAGGRVLVASEPGTGKTVVALSYLLDKQFAQTLIVAPANVIYKWEDECRTWIPGWSVAVVKTGKEPLPEVRVMIMSYGIMTNRIGELRNRYFDLIILDECHYVANENMRTRAARLLRSKHLLGLSGTPFLNKPIEMFSMLNMIDPATWKNRWKYGMRYCDGHRNSFGLDVSGASHLDELREKLQYTMVRRLKRDVLQDLPEIQRVVYPVEIDVRRSGYEKAEKDFNQWMIEHGRTATYGERLVQLNVLRQIIGREKIASAVELAKNILVDPSRKVVLYAHHKEVVSQLEHDLASYGVRLIVGEVSAQSRSVHQKEFQEDPGVRVMVISSAGGEGINLFRASDIIFVEREWNPAKEEQAEARLHRIGQRNGVVAHYILAKGTIDEKINRLIERKRSVFQQSVGLLDVETSVVEDFFKEINPS